MNFDEGVYFTQTTYLLQNVINLCFKIKCVNFVNPAFFLLLTEGSLENKTDLQVLHLTETYCHKTSTRPPSCQTPQQLTICGVSSVVLLLYHLARFITYSFLFLLFSFLFSSCSFFLSLYSIS